MQEFDEKYRRMPYPASPVQMEALRAATLARISAATSPTRRGGVRVSRAVALAAAAAVAVAVGITLCCLREPARRPPAPPTYEQLLSSAPADLLRRAAAENHDDLLYNQEL